MVTWVETAPAPPAAADRLRAFVAREAPVLAAFLVVAALVLATLPFQLTQDGWLSLVAGREVAESGLPRVDRLTALGAGREWIDQQWLAHLVLYSVERVGGLGLLLAFHAVVLTGAFALGALAARRLGGAPAQVALLLVGAASAAPWAWQLRAQTLALPLAIAVLWLLAEDRRMPSRRVLFVLPLLVLWANLHGSVLLGAGLVATAGVLAAVRRRPLAAVMLLGPLTALASPYGLELLGYYRLTLGNRAFAEHVVEWQPSAPGPLTAVFYVLVAVTVGALVRQGGPLERLILPLLAIAGVLAIRNVVWFALAALVLVPVLLSGCRVQPSGWPMRAFAGLAALGAVLAGIVALGAPARVERLWPSEAAQAAADTSGTVFADERLADWLLWAQPSLAGRVRLDARFELLRPEELDAVSDLYAGRGSRVLENSDVAVFAAADRGLVRTAERLGFRRRDGGSDVAVLVRERA